MIQETTSAPGNSADVSATGGSASLASRHLAICGIAHAQGGPRTYAEELAGCAGIVLPGGARDEEIVWSQYTIRCREPERVRAALEARGIEWRRYYPRPVCEEPGLSGFRRPAAAFPEAARACAEVISLPVRASCSPEVIREIAGVIRDALGG